MLVVGDMTLDPIAVAGCLCSTAHHKVPLLAQSGDRKIALKAALLVEHRRVDHFGADDVDVVRAQTLQQPRSIATLDQELGERGLVEDGDSPSRRQMLFSRVWKPVLAPEGRNDCGFDTLRSEPRGPLPPHPTDEASTLPHVPLV